jgi:hypothetical protein
MISSIFIDSNLGYLQLSTLLNNNLDLISQTKNKKGS